jgi:Tol biopolymer transport system component
MAGTRRIAFGWVGALAGMLAAGGALAEAPAQPEGATPELLRELKAVRHRIVYESDRDGSWDLFVMNADGSNPVNLTKTPDVDELYPKASPDGARICFVCDAGKGKERTRNLYVMRIDGTGRSRIADNAREPCWSADGGSIAFLKGEFKRYNLTDFVTKGLFVHDLKTGRTREHPNAAKIHHLYTLNWSPDGGWFVATVHGGMGFKHGILALEAGGEKVFNLELEGCRPDLSPDGKRIAWGHGDYAAGIADLDLSGTRPRATGVRNAVESRKPMETYHADWSPDGRYLAYSYGPKIESKSLKGLLAEFPGVKAPGWNVCVVDTATKNRWAALTLDGASCKEPDWVPARGTKP